MLSMKRFAMIVAVLLLAACDENGQPSQVAATPSPPTVTPVAQFHVTNDTCPGSDTSMTSDEKYVYVLQCRNNEMFVFRKYDFQPGAEVSPEPHASLMP